MLSGKHKQNVMYGKISKNWDTENNYRNCPKDVTAWFHNAVMCPKDAGRMANSVDPDQTAPFGAVWSGSALFAQTYLLQYTEFLWYADLF